MPSDKDLARMLLKARGIRNRAFQGAYKKGFRAGEEGKPKSHNPYCDERTARGSVTYSRAFLKFWDEGWEDANGKT
jgi:hypothetical protein